MDIVNVRATSLSPITRVDERLHRHTRRTIPVEDKELMNYEIRIDIFRLMQTFGDLVESCRTIMRTNQM